jgi:pheromone shutdown-related protein TraB
MERIFSHGKEIVLIGTAHISRKSIELVEKTIELEKPDIVGIELDKIRLEQLKSGQKWRETNIAEIIKSGKTFLFIVSILLSNIQRRFGAQVGVMPGSEMLKAIELSEKKQIPIILLDRDIQITMKRAFKLMPFTEKIKLVFSIISGFFIEKEKISEEKIEELKEKDLMTELMKELSNTAPTIKKVLVDERDEFIANKILNAPGKKIVAVVGAGHIEGIKKFLHKKTSIKPLLEIPRKKSKIRFLKFVVPALFAIIFAYAIISKGLMHSIQLFAYWFLINGSLSALGVLIARGHFFSIITAFLAAPFTSLHPALAAGWFAGATELKVRSPKVKDFEMLSTLNSYNDFSKNNVTRILLVTAYANIGSMIGTIIAFPYIISLLG